jgi:hypothetical protein
VLQSNFKSTKLLSTPPNSSEELLQTPLNKLEGVPIFHSIVDYNCMRHPLGHRLIEST